jgi:hypothetical protein
MGYSPRFEPTRFVVIEGPKFGSAYRVGGRLVLTCSHLLDGKGSFCNVRVDPTGVTSVAVQATVVWVSAGVDIALIELPESIKSINPVTFGKLPTEYNDQKVPFQFYGAPSHAGTYTQDGRLASGYKQVEGLIYLADRSSPPELLSLRLNPDSIACPISSGKSPWGGASGAAIVCQGLVLAVQQQHQRLDDPNSLQAQPLHVVRNDPEWKRLLSKHGIGTKFEEIRFKNKSIQKGKKSKSPIGPSNTAISMAGPEAAMVTLLNSLNCDDQQFQFRTSLKSNPKAAAFVIQSPCQPTRKWLVHRLIQLIPNHEDAIHCTINPKSYSTGDDLWGHLASDLSENSGTKRSSDYELVSQYLSGGNPLKPIIISIHNLDQKMQGFEDIILRDFWTPLHQLTLPKSPRNRASRIILFLTKEAQPKPNLNNDRVSLLSNLSYLSAADVDEWVVELSTLKRKKGQTPDQMKLVKNQMKLVKKLQSFPSIESSEPGRVITQLCRHVGFKKGIEHISPWWGKAS